MKINPSKAYRIAFLCISILTFLYSCKKEIGAYTNPSLEFIQEEGYISFDTSAKVGDTLSIKILAKSLSEYPLLSLRFERMTPTDTIYIDTGMYLQSINMDKKIIKSVAEWEVWNITARDRNRKESNTISLKIYLEESSSHGDITHIPRVTFGFQENNEFDGFYSLSNQVIYDLEEAYSKQENIHLLSFYDNTSEDEHTISSPGANIPDGIYEGATGVEDWDIRNTTRFILSDITEEDFDLCDNDSLIYASTFAFETGKRKAKNLTEKDIYAFVSDQGNFGLFKVKSLAGNEAGNVEIEIKMK